MLDRSQKFDPRQNMRSQTFEIFHYRHDILQPVSVHHHDFYEIYFFLSGQVEYRVEGNIYLMQPGDLLFISPLELHQPTSLVSSPYERIVLWIGKDYLERLSGSGGSLTRCFDHTQPGHKNLLRLTSAQRSAVTARFTELSQEVNSTRYGSQLWATGAFLQLMVELNRIMLDFPKNDENPVLPHQPPPLISSILAYINEHCCENITLDDLADRFYVSKYHLSHEFHQSVGTSLYRYIILKRLLQAKQMLAGGMSPGTVSHNCGFGDYANFYRAFRKEYGISPRTYAAGGRCPPAPAGDSAFDMKA